MPNTKQPAERADLVELRRLAEACEPITTDLYGDRYMQGPYSQASLTKAQDALLAKLTPAVILNLLAEVEDLRVLRDCELPNTQAEWRMECERTAELQAELSRLQGLSAATASRTVSDGVRTAIEDALRLLDREVENGYQLQERGEQWRTGEYAEVLAARIVECQDHARALRSLIPAPSVAEPAKCAAKIHPERFIREAADKAAVWSSDCRNIRVLPMSALDTILITLDAMQNHSKPYEDSPDCTPASAEQKCYVCPTCPPIFEHDDPRICGKAFYSAGNGSRCENMTDHNAYCGHSRACHAAADAGKVKPNNGEEAK